MTILWNKSSKRNDYILDSQNKKQTFTGHVAFGSLLTVCRLPWDGIPQLQSCSAVFSLASWPPPPEKWIKSRFSTMSWDAASGFQYFRPLHFHSFNAHAYTAFYRSAEVVDYSPTPRWIIVLLYTTQVEEIGPKTTISVTIKRIIVLG